MRIEPGAYYCGSGGFCHAHPDGTLENISFPAKELKSKLPIKAGFDGFMLWLWSNSCFYSANVPTGE